MCYRETVSAFLWSTIIFLIPDLSTHKRNTALTTKLFNILSGQTRKYLVRVSSTACYSRLDHRMDLPSHYRGIKISRNTGNENGWTNGNDWQAQPAKNEALHLVCCFSLN